MFPCVFVTAGKEYCTYEKSVAAPLFIKKFNIEKISDDAEIVIGCTGFYELYLNGENITDGLLAPFIANSECTVFYRSYRISEKLKIGENSLCVLLGNGFANPIGGEIWDQYKLRTRGAPAFAMSLVCGEVSFGAQDMEWTRSPLLFDDYRIGTYFDARIIDGIESGKCEMHAPTVREEPTGKKRFVTGEPIRKIRSLTPKILPEDYLRDYRIRDVFGTKLYHKCDLMKPAPKFGGIIYDFGENVAGVPTVTLKNTTAGQVIHMQFTELLFEGFPDYINVDVYPDGCCQQDIYVCRGADEEVYTPSFTYHGCRYCYLHGIDRENVSIELSVVRNDAFVRSDFECSEEISNLIFNACRRSDESNMHNIITDCPTREKNGWTGDAAISADHILMGYGIEKNLADWLSSIRDTQAPTGSIPCLVPCHGGCSDSVVWDSVLFLLPYYAYKYSGDTEIITDNADAMIKNLKYHLGMRDERGIVDRGMGDWLPVDSGAFDSASPLGFCCSAIMYEMCRMGKLMFGRTGLTDYAQFCEDSGKELLSAIRAEYCDGGIVTIGKTEKYRKPKYAVCQTSQSLGLFFGIFKDEEKQEAIDTLVRLIHEKKDSFDCGFLGIRAIFHVLSEYGYADLAHKMITKPTHPSFGNMIYRGETTVWERFVYAGGRTGSHNHHFMAEPSMWYMEDVLGIRVNPDMDNKDRIVISPRYLSALDYAKGHYENDNGKVCVQWRRDGGGIALTVEKQGNLDVEIRTDENVNVSVSCL
ncbi:MAG: family 78 glycoside hydrolase catalytic domain [Clostridia bacterium]|nr:family 78 glycoside hydrolase catalytic domain [Clostridia bacterium]